MFDNLSTRLQATLKRLRGEARITDENMSAALREVRMALLEADVALPVVKQFIEDVRVRALGQDVLQSLTPGQAVVGIVNEELIRLMGDHNDRLDLAARPPAVILVAGLQGAGKTTTVAKLARFLREREKKRVLVASCDVYRPAAIEQLRTLAAQVGVEFFPSSTDQRPEDIARAAVEKARLAALDVAIIDSAGRLHVDEEMMQEIRSVHAAINPVETLFVVDSMTGQDAANTAKAFNAALPLTGVILTKADGDARGGAALSIRTITGKPIKFLGVGEKSDALEPFYPDRLASRILGMGDIVSLVEEAGRTLDRDQAEAVARKIIKGKGFDLADFREQLLQMQKMGGIAGMLDKLPGMGAAPNADAATRAEKETRRMVAIIGSMTPGERRDPDMIRGSRKRRIATGSGTQVQDVNRLLKQFSEMQRMMKRMGKGGIKGLLRGLGGRLPGLG